MPNADLVGPRYHLVIVVEIDKTEVVTGVKTKSLTTSLLGSLDEGCDGSLAVAEIIGGLGFGV